MIWLVNEDNHNSIVRSQNGFFTLWQGSKQKGNGGRKNNIGLIMQIKHHFSKDRKSVEQNILFCGDCEYEQMPRAICELEYDLIVTAHHGSKHAVPTIMAAQNGRAVISVGSNSFGHPAPEHIARLSECGFRVFFTLGYFEINFKINPGKPVEVRSRKQNIIVKCLANSSKSMILNKV